MQIANGISDFELHFSKPEVLNLTLAPQPGHFDTLQDVLYSISCPVDTSFTTAFASNRRNMTIESSHNRGTLPPLPTLAFKACHISCRVHTAYPVIRQVTAGIRAGIQRTEGRLRYLDLGVFPCCWRFAADQLGASRIPAPPGVLSELHPKCRWHPILERS